MIRVALVGATGRTGRRVLELAGNESGFEVVAALTAASDPWLRQPVRVGGRSLTLTSDTDAAYDVLIDFSTPEGTVEWCRRSFERGAAFVSGTTGLSEEQQFILHLAAEKVPVLWAPNFSRGINLLQRLAAAVANELGEEYAVEVVEAHHDGKVDAPSGSALALARAIVEATGGDFDVDVVHGRCGQIG
ncbi:MAG: 4-hydroxy-tetrahydrodipicolinate reductase, partial [Planctomycetota bacterium]